jgi:hypothetical protein
VRITSHATTNASRDSNVGARRAQARDRAKDRDAFERSRTVECWFAHVLLPVHRQAQL